MDRPTPRFLRLAAASIAVAAGTAVWPLASATPVAQALDNTPWVLPSAPSRCSSQKVETGDVAGCVITFYDEPSATGWLLAAIWVASQLASAGDPLYQ